MIRFSDVVAEANADGVLEPVAGASVTVLTSSTSTPAVIFDELGAPISNPVTTDSLGRFDFFCRTGKYDLVVSQTSITPHTRQGVLIGDGTIHASDYAIADGISDAAEGLQAALDEASALVTAGGASVVVDLDGGQYLLGAPIFVGSRTTLQNGMLIADPGADWGDDGTGHATRYVIEMTSSGAQETEISRVQVNCSLVANGILVAVAGAQFNRLLNNEVFGFSACGIEIRTATGCRIEGNNITQGRPGAAGFETDADLDGIALWIRDSDQKIFRNILRWTGKCLKIDAGTCLIGDNHMYNGGLGAFQRQNPVIVENRGRGNLFTGNYFDLGEIRIYDTNCVFTGNRHLVAPASAVLAGVYVVYASGADDIFSWLEISNAYLPTEVRDGTVPYVTLVEDADNYFRERASSFLLHGTAADPEVIPRSKVIVRTGYNSQRVGEFRGQMSSAWVCAESSTTTDNAALPGFGAYGDSAVISTNNDNQIFISPSGLVGINGEEDTYLLGIWRGSGNMVRVENTLTLGTADINQIASRDTSNEIVGTYKITDREFGPRAAYEGRTVTGSTANGLAVISAGTSGVMEPLWAVASGQLRPWTNNAVDIGTASLRVKDIYLTNAPNVSSDERNKTDILDSDLGLEFIQGLRPVSYTVITSANTNTAGTPTTETVEVPVMRLEEYESVDIVDGVAVLTVGTREVPVYDSLPVVDDNGDPVYLLNDDGTPTTIQRTYLQARTETITRDVPALEAGTTAGTRTHYGLIAQEVKEALDTLLVPSFAGWGLADPGDAESTQHLRYDEFIGPLIKAVQELATRVTALEPPP
jgi:hypothetical protein